MALLTLCLLNACQDDLVFSHYESIPPEGWEKDEPLTITIPTQDADADGTLYIGMRNSTEYSFQSISVRMETTIFHNARAHTGNAETTISHNARQHTGDTETTNRTIDISLFAKNGKSKGDGISMFQTETPVTPIHLASGDSVTIRIAHNMKREILSGIKDVGIIIKR